MPVPILRSLYQNISLAAMLIFAITPWIVIWKEQPSLAYLLSVMPITFILQWETKDGIRDHPKAEDAAWTLTVICTLHFLLYNIFLVEIHSFIVLLYDPMILFWVVRNGSLMNLSHLR
jgi:hypothetical protein